MPGNADLVLWGGYSFFFLWLLCLFCWFLGFSILLWFCLYILSLPTLWYCFLCPNFVEVWKLVEVKHVVFPVLYRFFQLIFWHFPCDSPSNFFLPSFAYSRVGLMSLSWIVFRSVWFQSGFKTVQHKFYIRNIDALWKPVYIILLFPVS